MKDIEFSPTKVKLLLVGWPGVLYTCVSPFLEVATKYAVVVTRRDMPSHCGHRLTYNRLSNPTSE
jgi:hypothetical protein